MKLLLGALRLLALLGFALIILFYFEQAGLAVSLFLFLVIACFVPALQFERMGAGWNLAGALGCLIIAACFRWSFIDTVPMGYGFEPMAFFYFAQRLINEGFPYIPYDWYAHTAYSYFVALGMLVIEPALTAFKIVPSILAIITIGMFFALLRNLFASTAAWIGASLLASSHWYMYVSRNGYHHVMLPLTQTLFLLCLYLAFERKSYCLAVAGGVACAFGLHAYWGFYPMVALFGVYPAYLFCFHPERRRGLFGLLTVMTLVAVLLSAPFFIFYFSHLGNIDYVLSRLVFRGGDSASIVTKLAANALFLVWSLSGRPEAGAYAEYAPQFDYALAALLLVGLAATARRWIRQPGYALCLISFGINTAALCASTANFSYINGLLVSSFLMIAGGVQTALDAVAIGARAAVIRAVVVPAALLAFVGWEAFSNFEKFFYHRSSIVVSSPYSPPGNGFVLLHYFRHHAAEFEDKALFLPVDEPLLDFDNVLRDFVGSMPGFDALRTARPLTPANCLFTKHDLEGKSAVRVVVSGSEYANKYYVERLRAWYPTASVSHLWPPPPYGKVGEVAPVVMIDISKAELARYFLSASPRGSPLQGVLKLPQGGQYRIASNAASQVLIGGSEYIQDLSSFQYYEGGLHRLEVKRDAGSEIENLFLEDLSGKRIPLEPHVLTGITDQAALSPLLASKGIPANFAWRLEQAIELPIAPFRLMAASGDAFAMNDGSTLLVYGTDGQRKTTFTFKTPVDFFLAQLQDRVVLIDPSGRIFDISENDLVERRSSLRCDINAVGNTRDGFLAACRGGTVFFVSPENVVRSADGLKNLPPVADLSSIGDSVLALIPQAFGLFVLDRRNGSVSLLSTLPYMFPQSAAAVDDFGNLAVTAWNHQVRFYSKERFLLVDRLSGEPLTFQDAEGAALELSNLNGIEVHGDYLAALGGLRLYLFRRTMNVPANRSPK